MVGEEALTSEDLLYLEFLDKFERKFVAQVRTFGYPGAGLDHRRWIGLHGGPGQPQIMGQIMGQISLRSRECHTVKKTVSE